MTAGMHYVWRRKAARLAGVGVTGDIIDIASGTGDFAFDLLKYSEARTVVGLDFSPDMLGVAMTKTRKWKFKDKFLPVVGDAHCLPFASERFSGATIGFGVRNFANLPKALDDVVRVIKKGGKVTVLEIVRPKGKLTSLLFIRYFNWITPKLGRLFAGDYEAYEYLPESVQHFMTAVQLSEYMKGAGLINVTIQTKGLGSIAIISGQRP